MAVITIVENAAREKWSLTQQALDGLLTALGPDRDEAANRYLEIHTNLVRLFEWRGCPAPDEYADEAISRCARKIGEGEEIRDVATYCIGIARMLVREMGRAPAQRSRPLEEVSELHSPAFDPVAAEQPHEQCLERCLGHLSTENRDLILRYYQGDKSDKIANRKGLARLFGIPSHTLRMRALRLREKLQACAQDCVSRAGVKPV
jgi:DNA-directed RNA polymerase specialized sigma24 family protein